MDRLVASLVSACFCGVFAIAGCGDASAPGIDGPGAHGQGGTSVGGNGSGTSKGSGADAAADAGSGYRDPTTPDGGCSAPNMECSGICIALDSDPANCGACDNACMGSDSLCLAGKCSCGTPGMDYCDGVGCMDVQSDFNNCGSCGNMCDPNNDQACANGVCVPNDP